MATIPQCEWHAILKGGWKGGQPTHRYARRSAPADDTKVAQILFMDPQRAAVKQDQLGMDSDFW